MTGRVPAWLKCINVDHKMSSKELEYGCVEEYIVNKWMVNN